MQATLLATGDTACQLSSRTCGASLAAIKISCTRYEVADGSRKQPLQISQAAMRRFFFSTLWFFSRAFSKEKCVLDFIAPDSVWFGIFFLLVFGLPENGFATHSDDGVGAVVRGAVGATPAALFQRHKLQPASVVHNMQVGYIDCSRKWSNIARKCNTKCYPKY